MTNTTGDLNRAIGDLATVRRAIDRVGFEEGASVESKRSASNANLLLHVVALGLCLPLLLFDALSAYGPTKQLLLSREWPEFGRWALLDVAASLPVIVACFYFVVWRAARRSEENLSRYVTRNFNYLRNLSFVADLFVKFVVLGLLVEGRMPQWVAPVLSLFIADYLLQGRFFVLPVRLSISLGVACILVAALQYQQATADLAWPLALFFVVSAVSTVYVLARRGRLTTAEAAA